MHLLQFGIDCMRCATHSCVVEAIRHVSHLLENLLFWCFCPAFDQLFIVLWFWDFVSPTANLKISRLEPHLFTCCRLVGLVSSAATALQRHNPQTYLWSVLHIKVNEFCGEINQPSRISTVILRELVLALDTKHTTVSSDDENSNWCLGNCLPIPHVKRVPLWHEIEQNYPTFSLSRK